MELKVTPWTDEKPPAEEELWEELAEEQLNVYRWSNEPEYKYAGHTHSYHKILYVLKGSIKFDFPTQHETAALTSGDKLEIPSGIRHSAVVGAEGVTCLEAHIY